MTGENKRKLVLYTQRVDIVKSYGERRDCADQRIPEFIAACGYLPAAVPNVKSVAERMMEQLLPAGIVFTGGNSLVRYGGDAPERDQTEKSLLALALEREIPVYGFCRGMQIILDYFGCELEAVTGHVAVRHVVHGALGELSVNSYHNLACRALKQPLEVMARTDDGVIEAIRHSQKRIAATMWHPEREYPFDREDKRRLQELFL